jgi:hypothetical protein
VVLASKKSTSINPVPYVRNEDYKKMTESTITVEDATLGPKESKVVVSGTTIKLSGTSNYILWARTFKIFIGGQEKLSILLKEAPKFKDDEKKKFEKNYVVMN